MKTINTICFVASALLPVVSASPLNVRRDHETMIYDFKKLNPSPELCWKPCYDNFTCTILEVPLDYADPSVGTTGIAFIKYPGKDDNAEDIIINPGGPGGSGVAAVIQGYEYFIEKLGDKHNIIGMDSRGVNNSGPSVNCFPEDPISGLSQNLFYTDVYRSVDNSTISTGFEKSGAYGDWCSTALSLDGRNKTAGYVNTNAVATDMLRYIEMLARSKRSKPAEAKLWYYGISYGSILGVTFAAKYPDRIGRLLIDGIVDAEDYYFGNWETCLSDADEAVRTFYSFCFEAGSEACSFHKNASSAKELEERYWKLYDSIREHPIEVTDATLGLGRPITITWEDMSALMISYTYAPHTQFSTLSDALATLEEGNATLVASMDNDFTDFTRSGYDDRELRTHVLCMDSQRRSEFNTIEKYAERTNFLTNQSIYGGAWLNSWTGALCRNFKFSPPEVQTIKETPSANRTSHPLLIIGNTLDPVTPLRSAKKTSRNFPGSTVLTLNSTGHSTLTFPSQCIDDYTKAYFADGSLPPEDTICELDRKPFEAINK